MSEKNITDSAAVVTSGLTRLYGARARGEAGAMNEAWAALQQAAELDAQEPLLQATAARLRQLEQAGPAPVSNR